MSAGVICVTVHYAKCPVSISNAYALPLKTQCASVSHLRFRWNAMRFALARLEVWKSTPLRAAHLQVPLLWKNYNLGRNAWNTSQKCTTSVFDYVPPAPPPPFQCYLNKTPFDHLNISLGGRGIRRSWTYVFSSIFYETSRNTEICFWLSLFSPGLQINTRENMKWMT